MRSVPAVPVPCAIKRGQRPAHAIATRVTAAGTQRRGTIAAMPLETRRRSPPLETPAWQDSFATMQGARSLVRPTTRARAPSGAQKDSSARAVNTARRLLARQLVFAHGEVALSPQEDTRYLRASLPYSS